MYPNPYHSYTSPYAFYPAYPPYSLHSSEKHVQPVSYSALDQVKQDTKAVEKEGSAPQEVDTFTERFLNYLGKRKGATISVATRTEIINGTLEEVSTDCILVKVDEENYHIRPEGIVYFK
ncbi:DUF2642 domain-containing protein [Aneurinibacillus aneurinilyticus]|uniref:DUF2642 domain-containing protein n=1 Tax=Aneurinibacillus aneurinilyticus TaxID=1391 RepID=A0A848CRW1_ANEAE|nr:DUF2642 domain-containing protein [Aneurinibacillus aneurinilyticus]MCI1694422.1 DUF2642 domain-containing protein [Aneurinibacillus aneurinilyticus]MED0669074.1 DUF2642 domain-containing protein [Aneurinibacillus aneurinilyticus]NME98385.1 DUF2642 domain-containing protein [Aneurinibacillus aneurinilyticus]